MTIRLLFIWLKLVNMPRGLSLAVRRIWYQKCSSSANLTVRYCLAKAKLIINQIIQFLMKARSGEVMAALDVMLCVIFTTPCATGLLSL